MIPSTNFRLRSFSEYAHVDKSTDTSILNAIQTYILDIYRNIHSKGLCFGVCGVSSESESLTDSPFYYTFAVEQSFKNKDFIPFQTASPFKTPPEVRITELYKAEKSDSWIIGMNILEYLLDTEGIGGIGIELFIEKYIEDQLTITEWIIIAMMSKKINIEKKLIMILNKLLRLDYEQRFTTGEILQNFFSYSIGLGPVGSAPVLELGLTRYTAVKDRFEMFLNLDEMVEKQVENRIDNSSFSIEKYEIVYLVKELCVAPYLETMEEQDMFYTEENFFFVKLVLFIRVCVIYFHILFGVLHPTRNIEEIKDYFYFDISVGQLCNNEHMGEERKNIDLYEDVGKILFRLIDKNTEKFALMIV